MKYQEDSFYIREVLKGNTKAYRMLIEKHQSMVFTLALRLVRSREDAEEVSQDAFLKAYQALGSFRFDSKFSTWLYRIVYNLGISRVRKKKNDTRSLNDDEYLIDPPSETENAFEQLGQADRKKYLDLALEQLDPEDAYLLDLFYQGEGTVKEIAEITGLTESNVKIRLFRSRKKLWLNLQGLLKDEIMNLL